MTFNLPNQETFMPDWAPMSMKIDRNERDFHIKLIEGSSADVLEKKIGKI
jgi:hypothetical protein